MLSSVYGRKSLAEHRELCIRISTTVERLVLYNCFYISCYNIYTLRNIFSLCLYRKYHRNDITQQGKFI